MSYDEGQLNGGKTGSGSGLDADTVDNTEGADLGSSPDNKTIIKNGNGNLEAVLGWTEDSNSPFSFSNVNNPTPSFADSGNYSSKAELLLVANLVNTDNSNWHDFRPSFDGVTSGYTRLRGGGAKNTGNSQLKDLFRVSGGGEITQIVLISAGDDGVSFSPYNHVASTDRAIVANICHNLSMPVGGISGASGTGQHFNIEMRAFWREVV